MIAVLQLYFVIRGSHRDHHQESRQELQAFQEILPSRNRVRLPVPRLQTKVTVPRSMMNSLWDPVKAILLRRIIPPCEKARDSWSITRKPEGPNDERLT